MRRWTVPRWSKSAVAQAAVFVLLVLALVGQVRGGEARLFVILPVPSGISIGLNVSFILGAGFMLAETVRASRRAKRGRSREEREAAARQRAARRDVRG